MPDEGEEQERRRELKEELLEKIQEALEDQNFLESNIPVQSGGYWKDLNVYRSMNELWLLGGHL